MSSDHSVGIKGSSRGQGKDDIREDRDDRALDNSTEAFNDVPEDGKAMGSCFSRCNNESIEVEASNATTEVERAADQSTIDMSTLEAVIEIAGSCLSPCASDANNAASYAFLGGTRHDSAGITHDHAAMRARISDFLLAGPPELTTKTLQRTARDLQRDLSSANDRSALEKRREVTQAKVSTLLNQLEQVGVMAEFRKYSSLVLQEQLLVFARWVMTLRLNENVNEYSAVANEVLNHCPKMVPQNSKIFHFLNETVKDIKHRLLTSFHQLFEKHLIKSEELSNALASSPQVDSSWETFLASSRNLVLSFMMVSMLPAAARDSTPKQLVEVYQECLDSAFTPLWGRFYFHLTSSRDAGSMDQILWTFDYTNTFIHLLVSFCTKLTDFDSSLVVAFPDADFRKAGISQIIEKTCRFMRSHVAECLIILDPVPMASPEYSSSKAQICMALIENSLSLDHDIHKFQHEIGQEGSLASKSKRVSKSPLELPISAVFCSNQIVRNLWVEFDHEYFLSTMLEFVGPKRILHGQMDEAYAQKISEQSFSYYEHFMRSPTSSMSEEDLFQPYFVSPQSSAKQCFSCVYDCLVLFRKAYERYSYLPHESHDLFAAFVLEPLLLSILGLIMFRTNTESGLNELFHTGRLPSHVSLGEVPVEGRAVLDTACFADEFLAKEAHEQRGDSIDLTIAVDDASRFLRQSFEQSVTPPSRRFAPSWELLQAWIRTPDRRYVSKRQPSNRPEEAVGHVPSRFCAYDVIEKAFSLAREAGRGIMHQSFQTSVDQIREKKMGDFAKVILFVRQESKVMSGKLETLFDKVRTKSDKFAKIR